MISNKIRQNCQSLYVWIWLPNQQKPIVCGKLEQINKSFNFTYGRSYLNNSSAIALSPVELELKDQTYAPYGMNNIHPCIRDAAPDAWGRRIIDYEYPNLAANELDYIILANSNRIGALDFQYSSKEYISRDPMCSSLEQLMQAAEIVDSNKELPKDLKLALFNGTSIGGARPKASIINNQKHEQYIVKFSSATDRFNVIKTEFIAMKLASLCGINTAKISLTKILNKDVLLIKRFDRTFDNSNKIYYRKHMLSALSLFKLNEMEARYASYKDFTHLIRKYFYNHDKNLIELFKRLIFNILVSNNDDHARNHAAFWDGNMLDLTPAYDICPQYHIGSEMSQAMAIDGIENNLSKLTNALSIANNFKLHTKQAKEIIDSIVETIKSNWSETCEQAELSKHESKLLYQRCILNPFCFEGYK